MPRGFNDCHLKSDSGEAPGQVVSWEKKLTSDGSEALNRPPTSAAGPFFHVR